MFSKTNSGKLFISLQVMFLLFTTVTFAQKNTPDPKYQLLNGNDFVQSKNYYLLTLFQQLPDVKNILGNDAVLSSIAKAKTDSLSSSLINCGRDGSCFIDRMKFTDAEIKAISERLMTLYEPQNALGKLVQNHLVPSGTYVLFQNLPGKEMLAKAWEQDANGINFCIGVYAGGNKPNYPLIDSISFNTKDPRNNNTYLYNYVSLLYNTSSLVTLESNGNNLFSPLAIGSKSAACSLSFISRKRSAQVSDG